MVLMRYFDYGWVPVGVISRRESAVAPL